MTKRTATIDTSGIDFVKILEGYKDTAYRDQAGVWTIGYGTTRIEGRPVTWKDTCTVEQATRWLGADLSATEDLITKVVKVKITQRQFNSLCSLAYNIGHGGFQGSTLLRTLNNKAQVVEDHFTRWCKITVKGKKVTSQGLLNRRRKEWLLFSGRLRMLKSPF